MSKRGRARGVDDVDDPPTEPIAFPGARPRRGRRVLLAGAMVAVALLAWGCSGASGLGVGGASHLVPASTDPCLVRPASLSELFAGRQFEAGIPPEEQDRLSGGNDYATPREGCFFPQRGVPVDDLTTYPGDKVAITRFIGIDADPKNGPSGRRFAAAVSDPHAPLGPRSGIPITALEDEDPRGRYAVAQAFCVDGADQWNVNAALYGTSAQQVRDGVDALLADIGCVPAPPK